MFPEVLIGWDELLKCMDKHFRNPLDFPAVTNPEATVLGIPVHTVPCRPVAVERLPDIGLPVVDKRYDLFIQLGYDKAFENGNVAHLRSKPAAAKMIVQESVNAVHVSAAFSPGDDKIVVHCFYHISLIA